MINRFDSFITEKRLITYPRLIALVMWVIVLINIVFHDSWQGDIGGILGYDFLGNYSAGLLYATETSLLYDLESQAKIQQSLLSPVSMDGGVNIFSYPPHVALAYQALNQISYLWALNIWSIFSLVFSFSAVRLMSTGLVSIDLVDSGLSQTQLLILLLSFFPVIQGSVLDQEFLNSLGKFDVIYAWGTLHNTGSMWDSMHDMPQQVNPNGILIISI